MTKSEAFKIVLDLARQNLLDERIHDTDELKEEAERQAEAIKMIETISQE